MTKQEYEFSLREITKYQEMTCEHEHHDCDHNRCMACINGCYGDVCAFDVVIESIERLECEENKRHNV